MKLNCLFSTLAIMLYIPLVHAQTDVEQFIWHEESRYIQAYRDADYNTVMSLWHDNFLGWPSAEHEPIRKQQGEAFLKHRYKRPGQWDFAIEPQSIQLTGDIAITQYILKTWSANAPDPKRVKVNRIVHTWLKKAGQWKILGGMSAPWTFESKQ
jgi:ketosteroid isomerase-like protein